jgi:hypothetical protein
VDRLYGVPLEDFVAERGAAAKALRKAGEKEAAAQVAKLPKPSQVAWTANQLARHGADELLAAGEALREAQLGGGGRDAVREAAAAEREAVDALLARAGELRPLSRDALDRLRTLLHAVAGDEELREQFVAGRLVAEPSGGGGWPGLSGFVAPPSAPASRETGKRRASSGSTKEAGGRKAAAKRGAGRAGATSAGDGAATRDDEREQRERERRDRERERKAAERAEREAARRREEAERRKLERRLANARRRLEAARERLEAAREAYESAADEVARIEEQMA